MRDFKGMKRQRGRNRGSGGNNKPQQHNANRAFDSNGPEGIKVRGNAQHVFDKYQQLARDASSGGDRVLAENYLQHAEHYFRLIRATQPNRAITDIVGRDTFSSGYDIDFEDESGAQAYAEVEQPEAGQSDQQNGQDNNGQRQNGDRPQNERYQNDRPREDRNNGGSDRPRYDHQNRNRDDRPRDDRPRDDRPRDDRPGDDRPRDDNQNQNRSERPREEGQGQNRNRDRYEGRRNRDDRPAREEVRDPLAVVEPQATPLPKAKPEAPKEAAPRLRSSEGDESHAPAFLRVRPQVPAPAAEVPADAEAKPKRRRAKASDAPASEEA